MGQLGVLSLSSGTGNEQSTQSEDEVERASGAAADWADSSTRVK